MFEHPRGPDDVLRGITDAAADVGFVEECVRSQDSFNTASNRQPVLAKRDAGLSSCPGEATSSTHENSQRRKARRLVVASRANNRSTREVITAPVAFLAEDRLFAIVIIMGNLAKTIVLMRQPVNARTLLASSDSVLVPDSQVNSSMISHDRFSIGCSLRSRMHQASSIAGSLTARQKQSRRMVPCVLTRNISFLTTHQNQIFRYRLLVAKWLCTLNVNRSPAVPGENSVKITAAGSRDGCRFRGCPPTAILTVSKSCRNSVSSRGWSGSAKHWHPGHLDAAGSGRSRIHQRPATVMNDAAPVLAVDRWNIRHRQPSCVIP